VDGGKQPGRVGEAVCPWHADESEDVRDENADEEAGPVAAVAEVPGAVEDEEAAWQAIGADEASS
jgi:hypothetical protein